MARTGGLSSCEMSPPSSPTSASGRERQRARGEVRQVKCLSPAVLPAVTFQTALAGRPQRKPPWLLPFFFFLSLFPPVLHLFGKYIWVAGPVSAASQ